MMYLSPFVRTHRVVCGIVFGMFALSCPFSSSADTEKEVWRLVKSFSDLPTAEEMSVGSYKVALVSNIADYAISSTTTSGEGVGAVAVTLSEDREELLAVPDDAYFIVKGSSVDNYMTYNFRVPSNTDNELRWTSAGQHLSLVGFNNSWELQFSTSTVGVCTIRAVGGDVKGNYVYIYYSRGNNYFDVNDDNKADIIGMRLYLARTEIVKDPDPEPEPEPEPEAPALPEINISGGNIHDDNTVDLGECDKFMTVALNTEENVSIYWRYTVASEEVPVTYSETGDGGEDSDEYAGFELYEEPIIVREAGNLDYYAENEAGGRSAIKTISFYGTPRTTTLIDLNATTAAAEHYDLLGRKVPATHRGVTIVRTSTSSTLRLR